jgi:hypothetical protein
VLLAIDRLAPTEAGTRIDLAMMLSEAVARCKAAWLRLVERST